ncbi:FAD-dependent thymidylate synthase [Bacterioplanoides sp.]|uniref:FAD-dependent thymidylate synthase n=1 Tax=Bacterioplanoides sp. TaxID=2066072 RepID=UPI003B006AC3
MQAITDKCRAVFLDHMGDDLAVVQAAKVSFADDAEVQKFIDDIEAEKLGCRSHSALIRYLAKHNHWTPFAHTAIKFRVSAPVPIRTQCFKHKSGFVENEESRRYISCRPEIFIPKEFRKKPEGSVKQGSEGVHPHSGIWREITEPMMTTTVDTYMDMIADGVCPEQARFILPQGAVVNWVWTGSLAAFARFFNQRTDVHAQKEIRELAEVIGAEVGRLFPVSWEALTGGK